MKSMRKRTCHHSSHRTEDGDIQLERHVACNTCVQQWILKMPKKFSAYDLRLYDVQPPALVGMHDEFITGARLDNLLSCYVGLQSLLLAATITMRACWFVLIMKKWAVFLPMVPKGPSWKRFLERIAEALVSASC